MILKGSQRGGGEQLAAHLLNDRDNDHVTLHEVRGFVSETLEGALAEAHAVSKGTRCSQFMFSLSLNPPKDQPCAVDDLLDAANRAERELGLEGQPRAVVIHEKNGRRHAHVVWSRINIEEMKAVPVPFFKNRLAALSKELYLEHGWVLPDGHRENGWKNPLNFTLAEWQQAKRLGLDPRELKQLFAEAWRYSDGLKSFKAALEDRGYFLARGDKRGFVAVDVNGEVFSVARMVGAKTKEIDARLGSPDNLSRVAQVQDEVARKMGTELKARLKDVRAQQREDLRPLLSAHRRMIQKQRDERAQVVFGQDVRRRRDNAERQAQFRKGVRRLWDVLTGRAAALRRDNERAALEAHRRDVAQREAVFQAQMREREALRVRLSELYGLQRQAVIRLHAHVAALMGDRQDQRHRDRGRELRL